MNIMYILQSSITFGEYGPLIEWWVIQINKIIFIFKIIFKKSYYKTIKI